jgi:hypothetical protein
MRRPQNNCPHRRRSAFGVAALCVALVAVLVAGKPAPAQAPDPAAAKKALTEAAYALGMVRGVTRALDVVNVVEFTANGATMDAAGSPRTISRMTVGYDYVIPAARVDIETTTPDGRVERTIRVAAGTLAWDEVESGIFARPAGSSAADRLRTIWLLPHGVILAGARASDRVRVADRGGVRELTVVLPDGTEVKSLLDAKNFMTRVEMRLGAQLFSADYADYKDFQEYGVFFPSRIIQRVDGRAVADLTVTEALANPYMIFPAPKELRTSAP